MAQIKTNLQYGVTGSLQTANIGASQITNALMADNAIDSAEIVAGGIDTAHIADDQITLAKMASGTDGNVITYDASGNPAVVATGSSGQLLQSAGAGSPPVMATVAGGHGEAVDSWEFTSDFTGNAEPIASNWGRMNTYTAWQNFPIGTGWTQSSGVFTPPSTGLWFIDFQAVFSYNGDSTSVNSAIFVSGTAGQWGGACNQHHEDQGVTTWSSARTTCIVDVVNTTYSNFVVEFHVTMQDQSVTVNNGPHSRVHFWKIADT